MRRWVTTWCVLSCAAACWGRGVPMYREYDTPVLFGRAVSETPGDVAIDEAQRLERVAAAARAGIVGEDTVFDVMRRGDSPFSDRGLAAMATATADANAATPEPGRRRDQWLLDNLKLATFTPTNRAVAQGLGLDDGKDDRWGRLFDEIGETTAEQSQEEDEAEDAATWEESWERAETPRAAGGGDGVLVEMPRTGGGTEQPGSGNAPEGGTSPAPVAAGPGTQGSGVSLPGGNGGGGVETEMARVKEVLGQLGGGAGSPGSADLGGTGMAGSPVTGVSRDGFAPDWDTLLRAGSVQDLISANRGDGGGSAPLAGMSPGSGFGERGGAIDFGRGWGGTPSGTGLPGGSSGGWPSRDFTSGGLRSGPETWGGSWSGIGGGTTPAWRAMDTGGSAIPAVPVPGTGNSRTTDWQSRSAGGGYRPAWD